MKKIFLIMVTGLLLGNLCACGTEKKNTQEETVVAEEVEISSMPLNQEEPELSVVDSNAEDETLSDNGDASGFVSEIVTEKVIPIDLDILAEALTNCVISDYNFYLDVINGNVLSEWGSYAGYEPEGGFTLYDITGDNIPEYFDCIGNVIYIYYDGIFTPIWDLLTTCDMYYDTVNQVLFCVEFYPYEGDKYYVTAFQVAPEDEIPYWTDSLWRNYIDLVEYYPVPGMDTQEDAVSTVSYIQENFECIVNGNSYKYIDGKSDFSEVKVEFSYANMPYTKEMMRECLEEYYSR